MQDFLGKLGNNKTATKNLVAVLIQIFNLQLFVYFYDKTINILFQTVQAFR